MAETPTAPLQAIPDSLNHLIELNASYGVLICMSQCRRAVSPAGISAHLRRKHATPVELRRQVDRYVEEFPFRYDHSTVRLPADGLAPQPIIQVVDGFKCQQCAFKAQDRSNMRKHGNKIHKKKRFADEEMFDSVRLQSWFWEGKERYWIVDESQDEEPVSARQVTAPRDVGEEFDDDDDDDDDDSQHHDDQVQEDVDDQIVQEIEMWKGDAQERRLTLLAKVPPDEWDPWLRFTQWNDVLSQSQHNMLKTHAFTREPDPEETDLERLLESWHRVFDRCLNTLVDHNHRDTLKWWASPKNEAATQKPFELPQNTKSVDKYSGHFEGFICYVMRAAPTENWQDATETGVTYTEEQWNCIQQIRVLLSQEPAARERQSIPSPEELSNAEEGGGEGMRYEEEDQPLDSEVMRLCMLMVTQNMEHISTYDSPLMHYLAVRGINENTEKLRPPFIYTTILAGMLWVIRLIVLEITAPLEAWPELGLQSRKEIPSVRERVQHMRDRHLCEGSYSPASSILSQLAMGQSYNRKHASKPNIVWSEDGETIFYDGMPVEMAKVSRMGQEMVKELRALMLDLAFQEELPTVDLSRITDSMTWSQKFQRNAYSFINHPQNKDQVDVGYQYLLARARKIRGEWRMIRKDRDGKPDWIDARKRSYLNTEKKFLRKAMAAVQIESGQPARSPELGTTKTRNSVYSPRGWYVINGRLCFLTMYDKARKRRGDTEYIVRYLPDDLGQIMARYMVFVDPFARALDQRESEYLFADSRGPWAGEELTRALANATKKHLGVRLTVSAWRQVAIGIANKHLMRATKTWDKGRTRGGGRGGRFCGGGR